MSIVVGIISTHLASNKHSTREERGKVITSASQFIYARKQQLLAMGVVTCVIM